MAKKKYFLIVDTETTMNNNVADFGAVLCDKQGNIVSKCGALVREFYLDKVNNPLFHSNDVDPLWGKQNLEKRYANYDAMITSGKRVLASVEGVNKWLQQCLKYDPIWTAYNKAFDADKLNKSGIDMTIFKNSFCLWHASVEKWGFSKAYKKFIIENHAFGEVTKHGNMSYKTNAEIMTRFILNDPTLEDEPHTALEDAEFYELPILKALVKNTLPKEYMNPTPYNWRKLQVKDHFKPN